MELKNLRYDYSHSSLERSQLHNDPLEQFALWLAEAQQAQIIEPHGMTLSTVDAEGQPSSRVVLLRGFDQRGFTFFTNYLSRKGQALAQQPRAALGFWWASLERQIRLEGQIALLDPADSDAYFASRPYESQAGSAASPQSQPIASREVLMEQIEALKREHPQQIPRPAHWGGYRLIPHRFEFWQGRPSRLHDRFVYLLQPDGRWQIDRLAP